MDEDLHDIERMFFNNLDDYEESPSQDAWNALEVEFEENHLVNTKKNFSNITLVSFLIILLSAGIFLVNSHKARQSPQPASAKLNNALDGSGKLKKSNVAFEHITINLEQPTPESMQQNATKQDTSFSLNLQKISIPKYEALKLTAINGPAYDSFGATIKDENSKGKKPNSTSIQAKTHVKRNGANSLEIGGTTNVLIKGPAIFPVSDIDSYYSQHLETLKSRSTVYPTQRITFPGGNIHAPKQILLTTNHTDVNSEKTVTKSTSIKPDHAASFSITPFVSLDLAWYHLEDDKIDNRTDNAIDLEKEETHMLSFTYGALVDYKLNKKWAVQTGITVANTNITVDPKTIYAQKDDFGKVKYRFNTSSGYSYLLPSFSRTPAVGDSLYAITSTHSLHYLGIPVALTYSLDFGKLQLKLMTGVSTNILLNAKLETSVVEGSNNSIVSVDKMQGLKNMYFSGLGGVIMNYKIARRTYISFNPIMRFALNPINADASVKSYPKTFGFSIGIKRDL